MGHVTLGFSCGLAGGPLRAALADFVAESPAVELRLNEGPAGELYRQLTQHSVDLVVSAALPATACDRLRQESLWQERLLIAIPSKCELSKRKTLGWRDIATLPLIVSCPHLATAAFRDLLARIGRQPVDCTGHAASREALLEMVGIGMGVTIILESGVLPHANVVFRHIDEDDAVASIDALWAPADRNHISHRLLGHIRERGRDYNRVNSHRPAMALGRDLGRPKHGLEPQVEQ